MPATHEAPILIASVEMKFIVNNNTASIRPEFLFYNTENLRHARQKKRIEMS